MPPTWQGIWTVSLPLHAKAAAGGIFIAMEIMDEILKMRIKSILEAVINRYLCTGEPVGSDMLSKRHIPALSPATIRNIMSDMEGMGYLMQPHASAGRIPTDKGFRFYVDCILKVRELPKTEKKQIRIRCQKCTDIEKVMYNASSILSTFSDCMGIVLAPRFDNAFIKHTEFIKLGRMQVMVLLVSSSGIVHSRIVRIEEEVEQRDLERMSGYLNSIAKGLTIRGLKTKILEEMKKEKNLYNRLMAKALKLSKIALDREENDGDVYVEGKSNVLNQPEFINDADRMKLLLKAFEEKSVLVKILDKAMDTTGIQTFIGSENGVNEIRGCSIVTAPYSSNGNVLGTLGVIGPTRMNYARVIPLVSYTAGLLSAVMAKREAV